MESQAEKSTHGLTLPALRAMREQPGLSQEELATRAGLTRTAVVNLESGGTRARPSNALKLAQALRVPLDVLRGLAPVPPAEEPYDGVLTVYFDAAMRHAVYRRVGERHMYAAIPGMRGLWASGFTREEAERDLREALEWGVLTEVFEHRPLPAYDGASLEITEEDAQGTRVVYPVAPASEENFLDGIEQAAQAAADE